MSNVVHLWGESRSRDPREEAIQLDLFGRVSSPLSSYLTFVDISLHDQDSFFTILTKNPVVSVVDIRPRPIFRDPKFDHVEVIKYMDERDVFYYDCAISALGVNVSPVFTIGRHVNLRRRQGLSLCLFDDASVDRGYLTAARYSLKRSKLFKAELSPSALSL